MRVSEEAAALVEDFCALNGVTYSGLVEDWANRIRVGVAAHGWVPASEWSTEDPWVPVVQAAIEGARAVDERRRAELAPPPAPRRPRP